MKSLRMNEEGLREIQDNMQRNNIRIIGIPKGEEQGREKVMMENFPNLITEKFTQIRKHRESQSRVIQRGPL